MKSEMTRYISNSRRNNVIKKQAVITAGALRARRFEEYGRQACVNIVNAALRGEEKPIGRLTGECFHGNHYADD